MRTLWLISGSLVLGFVLGAGLTHQIRNAEKEPISSVHSLDYFVSEESFSEVHNAKAVLAGLSRQFLTELRSRSWIDAQEAQAKQPQMPNNPSSSGLILALENGIEEFKGTEHELRLIPDLLRALKSNGLFERWLQIYLGTLYTHPTDELVLTFARDAVHMGARTGREDEVMIALQHVCSIPVEFPGKIDLQSTVLQIRPRPSVVKNQHSFHDFLTSNPQNDSSIN